MRRAIFAALLLGTGFSVQGCCVGTVSRWDGDFPIPPSETSTVHWDEVASGDGGALLVERGSPGHALALDRGGTRRLTLERGVDLRGAQVAGGNLYRIAPEGIVRAPLDAPGKGEIVAPLASCRACAVAAGDLLVARPGCVSLVRGASARTIWQGEALALALDRSRDVAWIAGTEPLPVIDLVDLETGALRCRVPLPDELASPGLRIVLSGSSAVIYAHDRPLEDAILVSPELGAWPLAETWTPQPPRETRMGDETPRLLVPAPLPRSAGGPGSVTFGRVAALSGGRFVVASLNSGRQGVAIGVVGSAVSAETAPPYQTLHVPEGWPGFVSSVTTIGDEVIVAASDEHFLHVKPNREIETEEPLALGKHLRHGVNYVLNVPITACEIAVSFGFGVPAGCLVVPFSPLLFLVDPSAGVLGFLAPFWLPFVRL